MELTALLRPGLWRRVSVRLLGVTLVALMVPFLVGVALLMNAERTRIDNDRLQRTSWLERHYRAEAARFVELPEPERSMTAQLHAARLRRDLAAVVVAAEQQAIDSTREIQIGAGLTFLSMVVFVVAAVRFAHRRILLDRLGSLVQVGQHVTGGDYSHRCDVGGHDELTVVADSINGMLDTIARSHSELEARVDFRTNQLREAMEHAERAASAKGEFLAVVSHEIRTPMNAVLGASELLLETPMNDEQRELLQTIRQSGGMLLDLINDVLDYSKIEAGRIEIESTPFDLEVELETVVRVFEEAARTRGIELTMDMDPTIERMVLGDPMRVRQVAMNLISNALKFTSKGGVTLTVRQELGQESMVRCSVTDTGIGIQDVDQKRLFEAFVQADASTTRKYGGTGLGLAICRKLVEWMGGAISVQSTPGAGSTFTFTLKLRPATQDQREALAISAGLKGRSILIVGDDAARIEELGRVLQDYLADVSWAMTASTVAATFGAATRPEVVVLVSQQEEGTEAIGALFGEARLPLLVLGSARIGATPQTMVRRLPFRARRSAVLGCLFDLGTIANAAAAPASPIRQAPRVLVVDDNEINQRVVAAMLKRMGCEVSIAGDGKGAVEDCSNNHFDLVLMDYQMPGLDGAEATRRIRTEETQQGKDRVAIVALTANVGPEFELRCSEAGMDDFLTKPMQRSDLRRVLDRFVK